MSSYDIYLGAGTNVDFGIQSLFVKALFVVIPHRFTTVLI